MTPNGDIVFLSGVRTGFGSFGGSLKDLSATQLGVIASRAALERSGVEPASVDHVVFGNVLQTSADAIYLARHVGLGSGVPIETPAVTVPAVTVPAVPVPPVPVPTVTVPTVTVPSVTVPSVTVPTVTVTVPTLP